MKIRFKRYEAGEYDVNVDGVRWGVLRTTWQGNGLGNAWVYVAQRPPPGTRTIWRSFPYQTYRDAKKVAEDVIEAWLDDGGQWDD